MNGPVWLLMIFILVDGNWMAADYAVEDWKPSEYATEAECRDVEETATTMELHMQGHHEDHAKQHAEHHPNNEYMILPRKFECILK